MAYSDKVIDHYQNPKNVGTLDKSKQNVGTGLVGAPECGDVMRLQIEVDDNGLIKVVTLALVDDGCRQIRSRKSLARDKRWIVTEFASKKSS
jgi:NifU-like protein involved in Fe-S cluster formation